MFRARCDVFIGTRWSGDVSHRLPARVYPIASDCGCFHQRVHTKWLFTLASATNLFVSRGDVCFPRTTPFPGQSTSMTA